MKRKTRNPGFSIWGKLEKGNKIHRVDLGGSELVLKREDDSLLVKVLKPGEEDSQIEYEYFIIGSGAEIELTPALPDLPLVLRPEKKYSILPGRAIETWVWVPLNVAITAVEKEKQQTVTEIPVSRLSKTWFGNSFEGEPALDHSCTFLDTPEAEEINGAGAFCPVSIANDSSQILEIHRMCLRVPYLTLYTGKEKLYTNETQMKFRGVEQKSQITFVSSPPAAVEKLDTAVLPRIKLDKSLIGQSFSFIKNLYTL